MFGYQTKVKSKLIDKQTTLNRAVWTREELIEFLYASVGGNVADFQSEVIPKFVKGLNDAYFKILREKSSIYDILTAQADALTDIEYFN